MEKLNNIKVIFIDIDGTLTNSNKQVPKENTEAIKKVVQKGIKVVICSGRGNKYVEEKSRVANASGYIISSNGAQIYDYINNKTLFGYPMNKEVIKKITSYIIDKKSSFILNCSDFRYGSKNLDRKMEEGDKVVENVDKIQEDVYQLVVEANSYENLEEIIEYLNEQKQVKILNYSRTYLQGKKDEEHYYLDVNSKEVNKGVAIEKFLEIFNIKKEEAVCFGDHINDEDMFDVCGFGVAMGNANDRLRQRANFVTKTNDENGVAYFLENYII